MNILLLSDIHTINPELDAFMVDAREILRSLGKVNMLSSRLLAEIPDEFNTDEAHKAFVKGGIDLAADNLTKENIQYDVVIGFSVGGTILWKAIENHHLSASQLVCISSTRLRYETRNLPIKTMLFYGSEDKYAPNKQVMKKLADQFYIFPDVSHDFYKQDSLILAQLFKKVFS